MTKHEYTLKELRERVGFTKCEICFKRRRGKTGQKIRRTADVDERLIHYAVFSGELKFDANHKSEDTRTMTLICNGKNLLYAREFPKVISLYATLDSPLGEKAIQKVSRRWRWPTAALRKEERKRRKDIVWKTFSPRENLNRGI